MFTQEGTISLSNGGQCLVDSFSVTNPSGPSPPTICGANTGEHSEKKHMLHIVHVEFYIYKHCIPQ